MGVSIFEEPFGPNGVGGDKWWTLKADRVPGDFALDPLGLYPSDPEEQIEMKTKELNHCRLAMIGIAGMVVQELVSGGKSSKPTGSPRLCPGSVKKEVYIHICLDCNSLVH